MEAIESILFQTYRDFEFILIDDGSTDDTLRIIKHYAEMDNRIVYIVQENKGIATARNVGISMSQSKWTAILDSDDIALPERLEQQLAYVETNPDIVLLSSGCIEIDSAGHYVKEHSYPVRHAHLIRNMEKFKMFPPHSSCLYHAEIVKQLGGFNSKFIQSEDVDLWLRLSEVGSIACLPQPLIKLRKHSENISLHNHGKTQKVMGTAARVCHLLRLKGFGDPSRLDTDAWIRFIDWLTRKLEDEYDIDKQEYWANIRQAWYECRDVNVLRKGFRFCKGIALSRHCISILRQKLFGSNLVARLAHEWMKTHKNQR